MKKYIFPSILMLLALIPVLLVPLYAAASDKEEYSLTIDFSVEGGAVPGSEFRVFRALDINGEPTAKFAGYPAELGKLDTDSLSSLAVTYASYVSLDSLEADYEGKTTAGGRIKFSGLEEGMYLVIGSSVTIDNIIYTPKPFIVSVPYITSNDFLNDVTAEVKYDRRETETAERSVKKVWNDGGYSERPDMIAVQLIKDGEFYEEATLSEDNGWQYSWSGLDPSADWQITEPDVPEGYTVSIEQDGTVFVITNYHEDTDNSSSQPETNSSAADSYDTSTDESTPHSRTDESNPNSSKVPGTSSSDPRLPQTGQLLWPVPTLFIAGLVLFLSGAVASKVNDDDED